ncbi:MAG: 5'-methylthioadenosine/S-adenosylhomocysteine nucleosidase, partial [Oscillospiraceae bacterium]|nr:5'-methylthioadenosine/S-adenosylhomocysteine nucleosidase [Oscillospiraceae bacterium]
MLTALFYAMPSEINSLIHDAAPMEVVHGVSFYRLRDNLMACCGGVGKVNAAMAAALLIERYHPDLIINVGVAGCFEEVEIGTLVLAED